ncbi:MAG: hypothetical protein HUK21_08460 [Fibrobacteraceae bacterium]|nr:hypothetical protein [Fibrobacteraceae bacterium]
MPENQEVSFSFKVADKVWNFGKGCYKAARQKVSSVSPKAKEAFEKVDAGRSKLKGLSHWQKFLLLTVAACLPAGILLAGILFVKFKKK